MLFPVIPASSSLCTSIVLTGKNAVIWGHFSRTCFSHSCRKPHYVKVSQRQEDAHSLCAYWLKNNQGLQVPRQKLGVIKNKNGSA